jgi:two-component system, LytTR family, response regulator
MEKSTYSDNDLISVKTARGIEFLLYNEIIFIRADLRYSLIYIRDQEHPVKVYSSINSLERILPGDLFYRCHRSYLINMKFRKVLGKDRTMVLSGNHNIPVSRKCLKDLLKRSLNDS